AVGIAEDVVAGRHADDPLRAGKHHRLVPGDDLPPAVRVGGLRAAAEHGETILMEDAGVAGVAVDHRAARAGLAGELARDVAEVGHAVVAAGVDDLDAAGREVAEHADADGVVDVIGLEHARAAAGERLPEKHLVGPERPGRLDLAVDDERAVHT